MKNLARVFISTIAVLAAYGAAADTLPSPGGVNTVPAPGGVNGLPIDKTLAAAVQTRQKCDTQLPNQNVLAMYKASSESPQVPAALKPFVGAWSGLWENPYSDTPMCGIIVIAYDAAVQPPQPRAIYAWGSARGLSPGNRLVHGQLKDGRLVLYRSDDDSDVLASFSREGDLLAGLYAKTGSPGVFRKINDPQAEVQ